MIVSGEKKGDRMRLLKIKNQFETHINIDSIHSVSWRSDQKDETIIDSASGTTYCQTSPDKIATILIEMSGLRSCVVEVE